MDKPLLPDLHQFFGKSYLSAKAKYHDLKLDLDFDLARNHDLDYDLPENIFFLSSCLSDIDQMFSMPMTMTWTLTLTFMRTTY